MRTMTANALAEIAKQFGTEPVTIIEVQWTENGSIQRYGDVADTDNKVLGNIREVTGLDNVITISGVTQGTTGESAQIGIVLSDVSGKLKNILDQNDIHKQPAWVYQWFPNLDYSDRFLLFKGQISSPIEWDEGDRTVSFDIINQLEDAEVGFSAEEGDIEYLPEDLIGVAWPLVFGTCIHVPALRLRTPYKGILRTGFGVKDFTIAAKLDQIQKMCCPLTFAGWRAIRSPAPPFSVDLQAQWVEEPGCKCRRLAQINQWSAELALQSTYELSELEIIDGDIFPQNQNIVLDICGAKVYGQMSGTTFSVSKYVHPKASELIVPPIKNFLGCEVRSNPQSEGGTSLGGGFYGSRDADNTYPISVNPECVDNTTQERNNIGWDYLSTFPTADFFWAEPGCEAFLVGDEEIVYVANILPSTILRVAAYRTFENGVRELVTVPATLYTSRISDFNGYMVTEIVFNQLLSRRAEGWEDEIYISQTSSVGPNTVDILEWLITKYTNFSIDSTSFDDVRTKIDNYPSHFPILERRNILDVLREIAFQARCALYLRNDEFTIRYLSEEPSSNFTLDEGDVLPKSLILSHTETEELVTKFVAEWKYDYALETPNKVILRYNVKRYGTQEQKFDFYIYNILELVEKSATFWLIRMANTWRKLRLSTPITKLQAEVFDVASVSLNDFSPSTIKCLVEKASYNSENQQIDFELWAPVRSGEQEQFVFAWPSQIDVSYLWPSVEDQNNGLAGGSGPNVDVQAPALHPLAKPGAFTGATLQKSSCDQIKNSYSGDIIGKCRTDHGDKQPSDIDDEKPTVSVPGQGETDIPTSKNPTGDATYGTTRINEDTIKDEAEHAQETIRTELAGDGAEGNESGVPPDDPYSQLPCTPSDSDPCTVSINWNEVLIEQVVNDEDGFTSEPGAQGQRIVWSNLGTKTLIVNSLSGAESIVESINSQIPVGDTWTVGQIYPDPPGAQIPGEDRDQFILSGCEEPDDVEILSLCPEGEGSEVLGNV